MADPPAAAMTITPSTPAGWLPALAAPVPVDRGDLLWGSWELLRQLGGVRRRLIWDDEPGIGCGPRLGEGGAALAGTLATRITETAARLADQARANRWAFEDYLAAVLERR